MARCCTTHCQLDNPTLRNSSTQQTACEMQKSYDIKKRKFKESFEYEIVEDFFDIDCNKKIHFDEGNWTDDKEDREHSNLNLVCYQDVLFERLETGRWKSIDLGSIPSYEYFKYHEELVNYKRKMYNGASTITKIGVEFTDEEESDSDESDDLPEVEIEHVPLCKQVRGRSHSYKPKTWSKLGQVLVVLKEDT
ncbi:4382_t:CDS:2 [Paraglomus brasilianum]|uniref:4382_t:CDS:1 n=1 Tax=Paraglomus brasilianum TaxID=144538 RepID=A0A9N8WS44_9GLOM|nr:4382_t:CDS:2 [Paraglomus brasilianum]